MGEVSQLLVAIGVFINAVLAGLAYFRSLRNAATIQKLETNTNSIKDALVRVVGESEHAKGLLQGRSEERPI